MRRVSGILIFIFTIVVSVTSQVKTTASDDNSGLSSSVGYWCSSDLTDSVVREYFNSNQNLSVRIWSEDSDSKSQKFLQSLIQREGLALQKNPFKISIEDSESLAAMCFCNEMHRPYKVLLIIMNSDDGYKVMRFQCPYDCFYEHQKHLDQLISSAMLLGEVHHSNYFVYIRDKSYSTCYKGQIRT